jgi:(1->4)-alpha-D-glucan 1-alpha-D-glucosylmutase
VTTATHDTKRGEDTRARLAVVAELADEWAQQVTLWSRMLRARHAGSTEELPPDRNDEYVFYQLLLGAWPPELSSNDLDPARLDAFRERIEAAIIKSLREAKVHTTWAAPNKSYEDAMLEFIRFALDTSRTNAFLESFAAFQARIAPLGVHNSLVQIVLKLTVPGVPDIYQGGELWDFSLVDPDNRRPVDYAHRRRLLNVSRPAAEADSVASLLQTWQDGRIKLWVTSRLLALRRQRPALFSAGSYEPLLAEGPAAERICAFARQRQNDALVVAALLFPSRSPSAEEFADTRLSLAELAGRDWINLLDGNKIEASGGTLAASALFQTLPVAALVAA